MASTTLQSGGSVAIKDEGVTLTPSASSIDFVGNGVVGSVLGHDVTETISGVPGTYVSGETPSGAIDDNNTTFTLAHTPISGSLSLFLSGAFQSPTDDYSLTGTTITFTYPPTTGSNLRAKYSY